METALKTCFKCLIEKPIVEFYKHSRMADGHLNKCKECTKSDTSNNRANNSEYYREYDRKRGVLPHRKDANKERSKRPDYRAKAIIKQRENRKRNARVAKARHALTNAVMRGIVERPAACWWCGSTERVQGHHADYSNPLGVTWLCILCHTTIHKDHREDRRKTHKEIPF